jgi:hypothetical protein
MSRRPWRDFLGQDPALPSYDRQYVHKTEADRWEERLAKHIDHLVRRQYALKKRLQSRIRRGFIAPMTEAELRDIAHVMFPMPQTPDPIRSKHPH